MATHQEGGDVADGVELHDANERAAATDDGFQRLSIPVLRDVAWGMVIKCFIECFSVMPVMVLRARVVIAFQIKASEDARARVAGGCGRSV